MSLVDVYKSPSIGLIYRNHGKDQRQRVQPRRMLLRSVPHQTPQYNLIRLLCFSCEYEQPHE
jgi:hypothetical protein